MKKSSAAFTAACLILASAGIGGSFGPMPNKPRTALWYYFLRKPRITPSGAAIGAAWSLLDVLLFVSGYRLLVAPPTKQRREALIGWVTSVAGVAVHPMLFFGRRSTIGGLAAALSMVASSTTTLIAAAKVDGLAALCTAPLAIWSVFAGLLSEQIVREN